MDWGKFFKENMMVILLGLLVVLLAIVLLIPTNKQEMDEKTGLTIDEKSKPTQNLPPDVPNKISNKPQEECSTMCDFRGDKAKEVKNDDGILTCVCENGYERVIGRAE